MPAKMTPDQGKRIDADTACTGAMTVRQGRGTQAPGTLHDQNPAWFVRFDGRNAGVVCPF
jgi:hypothetical protein